MLKKHTQKTLSKIFSQRIHILASPGVGSVKRDICGKAEPMQIKLQIKLKDQDLRKDYFSDGK